MMCMAITDRIGQVGAWIRVATRELMMMVVVAKIVVLQIGVAIQVVIEMRIVVRSVGRRLVHGCLMFIVAHKTRGCPLPRVQIDWLKIKRSIKAIEITEKDSISNTHHSLLVEKVLIAVRVHLSHGQIGLMYGFVIMAKLELVHIRLCHVGIVRWTVCLVLVVVQTGHHFRILIERVRGRASLSCFRWQTRSGRRRRRGRRRSGRRLAQQIGKLMLIVVMQVLIGSMSIMVMMMVMIVAMVV